MPAKSAPAQTTTESTTHSSSRAMIELSILVASWYVSSALSVATSKQLVKEMDSFVLTALQLIISIPCGALILILQGASSDLILSAKSPKSNNLTQNLYVVALAFVLGFVTLNFSFSFIPIPLAMALRAAEPLVAVAVAYYVTKIAPSANVMVSLVVIVLGVVLCTLASGNFSAPGVLLVVTSNVCFAVRSVVGKEVQREASFKSGGIALFFHICLRGSLLQCLIAGVKILVFAPEQLSALALPDAVFAGRVLLNGVCYFAYLAFSFLILARVAPVTHTVLNAMRRPVTIIMSCIYLQTGISAQVAGGIAVACVGSALYSKTKMAEAAKPKSQ